MNAWQRLAWIEWYRSFRWTGKDNHDFFWLAVLLWLTLTLALLLWGSREGLLNRFIDVSLGNLKGIGIPIWVVANNEEGIGRDWLEASELTLFPYREVESFEVALPSSPSGQSVWGDKVRFTGWAVSSEDPLWQLGRGDSMVPVGKFPPLEIVLSESLFEQYFDCQAYMEAVQQRLPFGSYSDNQNEENRKVETGKLSCLTDNQLWLEVKVGVTQRELLPFQIHWLPRIPTMYPLAFLFPLSTLHTLQVSGNFTQVRYYPEAQLSVRHRVKEVMIWRGETGGEEKAENLARLKSCLGELQEHGERWSFQYPLPRQFVEGCLQWAGIPLHQGEGQLTSFPYVTITEESISHLFEYERDYLTLFCDTSHSVCQPCDTVIQSSAWRELKSTVCADRYTTADMVELVGGYQKALVYVKNRADLAAYLEKLPKFPQSRTDSRPAFYVHPTYQDAFMRFLFIQKVMDLLKVVYSPFFFIFLVILLIVQVGMVITHRQHNYGILLAKGVSWGQLYQIILAQVTLSFGVALLVAVGMMQIVQGWLSVQFAKMVVQKPYIDHILVSDLTLLPLSIWDYTLVAVITLLVSYLMVTLMFRHTVPGRQVEPAGLFKL